jgi:3-deoxy-D-manno-octulosonate 8-phosphate phosphatase (KDO 8-P phosphatase)
MDIEQVFKKLGGTFLTPPGQIQTLMPGIKAFIFDWDGVFNNGMKTGDAGSPYSEIDSMGINLLRFSYWLKYQRTVHTFIITGMNNHSANEFAKREHFDGIFMNLKHKIHALETICESNKITPDEVAFIFDDVIDIAASRLCGLSFFVNRKANPLLLNYIKVNRIGNYISASSGEEHAVREICELLTGLNDNFDKTVEMRIKFKGEYEDFLNARNKIVTRAEIF